MVPFLRIVCANHRHGRYPVLRGMASNVAVELDAAGNLKPSEEKSTKRIGRIVAAIMTLGRTTPRPDPDGCPLIQVEGGGSDPDMKTA